MPRGVPISEKWLVFIDTNALLSLYRITESSAANLLAALERHKGSIIMNDQVHMEFLTNRQSVIRDAFKAIPAAPTTPNAAPIIANTKPFKALRTSIGAAQKAHKRVLDLMEPLLKSPSTKDPIFQMVGRLYAHDGMFNIRRPNSARFAIRREARKRHSLGYPPRRHDALSIGDAVNWETIIHCAKLSTENHHILIVSRDSDYGYVDGKKGAILNDLLQREFKKRVSQKRKILLVPTIHSALAKLDEAVDQVDVDAEDRSLDQATLIGLLLNE